MESILEGLESIGDVTVSRYMSSVLGQWGDDPYHSIEEIEWLVTFTTLGSPTNAGDVPLLYIATSSNVSGGDVYFPQPQSHNITISKSKGFLEVNF